MSPRLRELRGWSTRNTDQVEEDVQWLTWWRNTASLLSWHRKWRRLYPRRPVAFGRHPHTCASSGVRRGVSHPCNGTLAVPWIRWNLTRGWLEHAFDFGARVEEGQYLSFARELRSGGAAFARGTNSTPRVSLDSMVAVATPMPSKETRMICTISDLWFWHWFIGAVERTWTSTPPSGTQAWTVPAPGRSFPSMLRVSWRRSCFSYWSGLGPFCRAICATGSWCKRLSRNQPLSIE